MSAISVERMPSGTNWQYAGRIRMPLSEALVFDHRAKVRVLSAVEMVQNEDGRVTREWHVSVSHNGGIPDNLVMEMVRRDFGMQDAFEDNHQPGIVRNLWLAIDPADRKPQCDCVANERPHEQGCRIWRDAPEETER